MNQPTLCYLPDAREVLNLALATRIQFTGKTAFILFDDSVPACMTISEGDTYALIHALGRLLDSRSIEEIRDNVRVVEQAVRQ